MHQQASHRKKYSNRSQYRRQRRRILQGTVLMLGLQRVLLKIIVPLLFC